MGCAPSIHVSQSGIVYCREEIREPSSVRASSLSEVINHYHSEPGATAVTSTVRITRGRFSSVDKRKSVETETSFDLRKMDEISQVRIVRMAQYILLCGHLGWGSSQLLHISHGFLSFLFHLNVLYSTPNRKKGKNLHLDR